MTKHGFLVREGDALERLAGVSEIAFDKTGTLTYGMPQVTAVWASETAIGKEQLYRLAAAAEASSEHPLGKAVVRGFQQLYGTALPRAEQSHMIVGSGVTACIEGKDVRAGNESMMEAAGTVLSKEAKDRAEEYIAQGSTIIYVAVDSAFAGFLALTDTVRREKAHLMMQDLTRLGVQPVLLTGDNENAAKAIASSLWIRTYTMLNAARRKKPVIFGITKTGRNASA